PAWSRRWQGSPRRPWRCRRGWGGSGRRSCGEGGSGYGGPGRLAGQAGLAAGRGSLVQHALRHGPVKFLGGQSDQRAGRFGVAVRDRGPDLLRVGLQRGSNGLVAQPPTLVLTVPLDLGLDVRHGGRVYQPTLAGPPGTLAVAVDQSLIRNFCIVAHID